MRGPEGRTVVAATPALAFAAGAALWAGAGVRTATGGPAITAGLALGRSLSTLGLVLSAETLAFVALAWPAGRHEPRLGLVVVGAARSSAARDGRRSGNAAGAVVLFTLTAATFVYAGPAAPGPTTVAVTLVHIAAACTWTGGLAALAVALVPSGATADLDAALHRFALVAPASVAVLAVSGSLHGWLRAGSAANLATTGYGHVYWFKVAAVAAMLAVAGGSHRYVTRWVRPARGDAAPLHLLGLFLGAEAAFGVLMIVLTGTLVDAPVG